MIARAATWMLSGFAILMLVTLPIRGGQEYCALRVRVLGPELQPVDTVISLYDEENRLFSREQTVGGQGDLCDLGFGTYRLEVGHPGLCSAVTVNGIRDHWPNAMEIKAVMNRCGGGDNFARVGCVAALRVKDASGGPLPGVDVGAGGATHVRSDGFGRVWVSVPQGVAYHLVLKLLGYRDEGLEVECGRHPIDIKKEITLERTAVRRP